MILVTVQQYCDKCHELFHSQLAYDDNLNDALRGESVRMQKESTEQELSLHKEYSCMEGFSAE